MSRLHATVWVLLILSLATQTPASYYVYQASDGVPLLTDQKMPSDEYTLLAVIARPKPSAPRVCRLSHRAIQQRVQSQAAIIDEYAALYGMDPILIKAIIMAESCFETRAVSRVGAKGLMQLMPETAKLLGVNDVFDARDNIDGGTRYFASLLALFSEDVKLALAAYNAGPNAVEIHQGIPPYQETQRYVQRVLQHYETFGGDITLIKTALE